MKKKHKIAIWFVITIILLLLPLVIKPSMGKEQKNSGNEYSETKISKNK